LRPPLDAEKTIESSVKELMTWTVWLNAFINASGKEPQFSGNRAQREVASCNHPSPPQQATEPVCDHARAQGAPGLYEELIEYVTSTSPRPRNVIVLGAAGYGITTELMSVAVRAVKDDAGPVFMHKPGTALLEGDIEFAASIFPNERPVFIIDNASDFVPAIALSISRLRDTEKPSFFLLGERKNEWRQSQGRFHPREFEIEALTDPEINRLLDCLRRHGALGALEHLDPDIQLATIKQKLGKDLLVTMREATEDNQFDAILEDEFRGIDDDLARKLYLVVCGFYQHGAYVREQTC
jgi:hypothetical protein